MGNSIWQGLLVGLGFGFMLVGGLAISRKTIKLFPTKDLTGQNAVIAGVVCLILGITAICLGVMLPALNR